MRWTLYPTNFIAKIILVMITVFVFLSNNSCKMANEEYSIDEQWDLARSRVDIMKDQLDFSITLDKERINFGEPIVFIAHFTNKIDSQIVLRIPQQTGVIDADTINTTLEYSIIPTNRTISIYTPLSSLSGFPLIFGNPILYNEFETLNKHEKRDVKLEIPNIVYAKDGTQLVESKLPPGQYLVGIEYQNFNIGYEVDTKNETLVADLSAWVGEIKADPVVLTVLP